MLPKPSTEEFDLAVCDGRQSVGQKALQPVAPSAVSPLQSDQKASVGVKE